MLFDREFRFVNRALPLLDPGWPIGFSSNEQEKARLVLRGNQRRALT
jgi:hypothetical protein